MSDLILADEHDEPKFERINRFQAIVPGHYVRARDEIADELIPEGEILAIAEVDYVDNLPHTVKVRAHPRHYGQKDRRNVKHVRWELKEHEFLIRDFMAYFEPASQEEAQARRSQEQLEAQAAISKMQTDLQATQSDPQKMSAIIAEGLADLRKSRGEAEPTTLPAVTDGLPPLTLGTALSRGVDEHSVMQLRQQANHQHEVVSVQARWLQQETTRIGEAIKALMPYYTEQGDVAMASAKDMQEYVHKIVEGIKSLDLYLGKDVFVHQIKKGRSAPVSEPLSILQRKLIMREEMAVFCDVDEFTDYSKVSTFMDLLTERTELVDQIFPAPRCIVCMAVARENINYVGASPIENAVLNMQNKKVFLLVRDGENIHYLVSPVESHLGTSRLFPTRSEGNSIFTGMDGAAITFESLRYTAALKGYERHALHYKRLLILLCGLDHRVKLFGEFYPGDVGLSFVSMDFQKKYMHFIADDDASGLIASSENRPKPVMDWIKGVNSYLTSGSRVFGVWEDLVANEHAAPGAAKVNGYFRGPADVEIAFSGDQGTCVEKTITTSRESQRKVKIYPKRYRRSRDAYDDSLPVPFLVLDAIEPETLHFYVHDRQSRIQNVQYIRLFKRALAWLVAERGEEQPTRDKLLHAIIANGIVPEGRSAETLSHAIRLWRSANRGKSLPNVGDEGGADWNEILDVVYLIEHAAGTQLERVTEYITAHGYTPVRLSVTGKARLVLYVEPKADERDDRITPHVWLRRIVLRLGKRSTTEQSSSWTRLPNFDPAEHEIASLGDATYWLTAKSDFRSLKMKQELIAACEDGVDFLRKLATDQEEVRKLADRYLQTRAKVLAKSKCVDEIGFSVPVGLAVINHGSRPEVGALVIGCSMASSLIYNLLEDGPDRTAFHKKEIEPYYSTAHQISRLKRDKDRRITGGLFSFGLLSKTYVHSVGSEVLFKDGGDYRWSRDHLSLDKALKAGIEKEGKSLQEMWLGGGLIPGNTDACFDNLLGITSNIDGYAPGSLWVYVGEPGAKYLAFYNEVKGPGRVIHGCLDYDPMFQASWLTEVEREAVFKQLLTDWPTLIDGSEVKDHPLRMEEATFGARYYMTR